MSSYTPLITVQTEHEYFKDARCETVSYQPDFHSLGLMNSSGLLLKLHRDGFSIYYNGQDSAGLENSLPVSFWFRLTTADPHFSVYTSPGFPRDNALLYLANRPERDDATTSRENLATSSTISMADVISVPDIQDVMARPGVASRQSGEPLSGVFDIASMDDVPDESRVPSGDAALLEAPPPTDATVLESVAEVFTLQDVHAPPVGMLQLTIESLKHRTYFARFKSRRTYWKYFLLGSLASPTSQIDDMRGQIRFEGGEEVTLPNGQPAIVFTSTTSIDMREFSEQRFSLSDERTGTRKPVIEHLPAASKDRFYRATVNGKTEQVSDIYINS